MKLVHAVGASLTLLQTLAVLPIVFGSGMLVDFVDNPATDWTALLASESLVNGVQLLAMDGEDDGGSQGQTDDPSSLVVAQLRQPGDSNVFDQVFPAGTTAAPTNTTTPSMLASGLEAAELLTDSTETSLRKHLNITERKLLSVTDITTCSSISPTATGSVNVLITLSSCYSGYGQSLVDNWIEGLKKQNPLYFKGDTMNSINYVKKLVDDGCNCPLAADTKFDSVDTTVYAAVISITVYQKAATTVENFVSAKKIPVHLKYVYYHYPDLVTAIGGYNPIRFYNANGKCFMDTIDPFTVSRAVHCSKLPGGVPTSYVDANGVRQCVCGCAENYAIQNGVCTAVVDTACQCPWEKAGDGGYKFEVTDQESLYKSASGACVIKNLSPGVIPVPIPRDNYVDHIRTNDGDLTSPLTATSPQIDLTKQKASVSIKQGTNPASTEVGDTNPTTVSFTWKDFQSASPTKLSNLEFNFVGKYNIGLLARDYNTDTATCSGCLAIVDSRRPIPSPNYQCPTSVGSVTTELTATNIQSAQTTLNAVGLYKDKALNDPCSPNVRCDDDFLKLKKFCETGYETPLTSLSGAPTFFDKTAVKSDLIDRLKISPFDSTAKRAASVTDVCTRCAYESTKLREWWTPYSCSPTAASPVVSQCDGIESTRCTVEQCVQVNGKSIALSIATLTDTVKANSKNVVKNLNNDASTSDDALKAKYSLDTSVHVALECSEFPTVSAYQLLATDGDDQIDRSTETCSYTSKIVDLINIASTTASSSSDALLSTSEIQSFVSWRYNIDSGNWKAWSATAQETFAKASSTITVEAWTQCGIVATFTFKVELHLNNIIHVCDYFESMWYQSTVAPQFIASQQFCLFPKSDFAEITFDYHPNIGIDFDTDKFQLSVADIACSINYDGVDGVAIVGPDDYKKSFEIVKQFSVNGLSSPTKEKTLFTTTCKFTYSRKTDNKQVFQTCNQKFILKDCDIPVFNKPCELDGKCDFNKCASKSVAKPDLYQACGGNRIAPNSAGKTALTTTDSTCCDSCDTQYYSTQCVSVNNFPASAASPLAPVKRCEAVAKTTTTTTTGNYLALEGTTVAGKSVPTIATALLAASAMVALVALVVVKRRQPKVKMEDDVYYPLMN